ncbi:hypothetical protein GH714_023777 [Hevea brasiliensis]|uniref:Gnk2-homologous domain-containing protein n=1 Tax=Hevea brasiliensis TaxID=3981 RepID=A0A6A6KEY0_HEVBR|nr:hypothetical protein GH714_023777 [Hevea brasiliensis]
MQERQIFVANFLATMDAVTPLIARLQYGAVINGTGNNTVYTFGECMKDLDQTDCNLCFASARLRYDDYNFFNETLSSQDETACADGDFSGGNKTVFSANAMELVRNLSVQAVRNDGFFVGSVNRSNVSVYGLAQCWELVNGSACETCLANAVSKIANCTPKEEGRVLNAGCYLRYSIQKFYNNSGAPSESGGSSHLAVILAVTSSTVAVVLFVTTAVFFMKKRIAEKRRQRKELGALLTTVNNSKLNFSYESLEKATNYFHLSNKLGQGGSGSVYKVWNLHGTGRLCEAVDPILDGNFQEEEASRLLQIGLLCVQASAEQRPAMSVVVKMLTNNHEIPQPTQPPPFLNPSNSSEISPHSRPVISSSQAESYTQSSGNSMTQSWIEPR